MVVLSWIIAVGGAIGAVSVVWAKLVKPVVGWGLKLDRMMEFVEAQMVPNGGTSLRDSVNRIEARLASVEEHLTLPK